MHNRIKQAGDNILLENSNKSLFSHITEILLKYKDLEKNTYLFQSFCKDSQTENLLDSFFEIFLLSLNFGKINPTYQSKIREENTTLTEEDILISSHLSAIFNWISFSKLIDILKRKNAKNCVKEGYLHGLASTYVILLNNIKQCKSRFCIPFLLKSEDYSHKKQLRKIIVQINEAYPSSYENQLQLYLQNEVKEIEGENNYKSIDPLKRFLVRCCINNDFIKEILDESVDQLRSLIEEEKIGEKLDEILYFWEVNKNDSDLILCISFYYVMLRELFSNSTYNLG